MKRRLASVALPSILILALAGLSVPTTASAMSVSLLGGVDITGSSSTSRIAVPTAPSFDSKLGLGFGASLRASSNPFLNFELGILYMARKYGTLPGADVTFNMLEFPAMLRFTLIPVLSLGFGGYYAIRIGDSASGTGPAASSFNKSDLGLVAAAGFEFPVGPAALLIEARYLFGLTDMDADAVGTLYTRNWQFLAGVRLGL